MTHGEFIEKFNKWEPQLKAKQSGKTVSQIASDMNVLPMVAGTMLAFVERNSEIPRCEWLSEMTQDSVRGLLSIIRITPLEAMREDLIKHFQIKPNGSYKPPESKLINLIVLRKVLNKSGLKWYEREGKPCVHWDEHAV